MESTKAANGGERDEGLDVLDVTTSYRAFFRHQTIDLNTISGSANALIVSKVRQKREKRERHSKNVMLIIMSGRLLKFFFNVIMMWFMTICGPIFIDDHSFLLSYLTVFA